MNRPGLKALGVLLLYPTAEVAGAVDAIAAALADEPRLSPRTRMRLAALLDHFRTGGLLDLEETYVDTFDRGRARSLHLFEHVHGEARERGQAMVDLRRIYEEHGFVPTTAELPDFLPLVCEFLSLVPADVGDPLLSDAAPILAALRRRLELRLSPYAAVLDGLLDVAGQGIDADRLREVEDAIDREDAAGEPADLDREWEEPAVTFGALDRRGRGAS